MARRFTPDRAGESGRFTRCGGREAATIIFDYFSPQRREVDSKEDRECGGKEVGGDAVPLVSTESEGVIQGK